MIKASYRFFIMQRVCGQEKNLKFMIQKKGLASWSYYFF